jgi:hypothetical protein
VNWKRFWRKRFWPKGLRKTTRNISRNKQCSGCDSNRDHPEYKSGALPLRQAASTLWTFSKRRDIYAVVFVLRVVVVDNVHVHIIVIDFVRNTAILLLFVITITTKIITTIIIIIDAGIIIIIIIITTSINIFPRRRCVCCRIAISECRTNDCNVRKLINGTDILGNRGYTWKLSTFSAGIPLATWNSGCGCLMHISFQGMRRKLKRMIILSRCIYVENLSFCTS